MGVPSAHKPHHNIVDHFMVTLGGLSLECGLWALGTPFPSLHKCLVSGEGWAGEKGHLGSASSNQGRPSSLPGLVLEWLLIPWHQEGWPTGAEKQGPVWCTCQGARVVAHISSYFSEGNL